LFLKQVEKKFPGDKEKIERLSLIQGTFPPPVLRSHADVVTTEGYPQYVRMANLAVIGSKKVNGVAELHSELVRTTILKDFVDYYGPDKV
jgi:starch phosphorylase